MKHLQFQRIWIMIVCLITAISCHSSERKDTNKLVIEPYFPVQKVRQLKELEAEYSEMLKPILELKKSESTIYWFIVSWLKVNYKTPNWTDYNNPDWSKNAKERGIDCSGFSRIMQDKIFEKKIRGGSQGIFDQYCDPISRKQIQMGDLVFFKAPYSKTDRITHVGVYLKDEYFVHATSPRSAAKGLGLKISSLDEKIWTEDLLAFGRIKSQ